MSRGGSSFLWGTEPRGPLSHTLSLGSTSWRCLPLGVGQDLQDLCEPCPDGVPTGWCSLVYHHPPPKKRNPSVAPLSVGAEGASVPSRTQKTSGPPRAGPAWGHVLGVPAGSRTRAPVPLCPGVSCVFALTSQCHSRMWRAGLCDSRPGHGKGGGGGKRHRFGRLGLILPSLTHMSLAKPLAHPRPGFLPPSADQLRANNSDSWDVPVVLWSFSCNLPP